MCEICCEFFIFQRINTSAQWACTASVSVSPISDFWKGRHPRLFFQASGANTQIWTQWTIVQNLHRNLAAGLFRKNSQRLNISEFHHFDFFFTFHKVMCYRVKVWRPKWQRFYCKFVAKSKGERIFKIGQHFTILWTKNVIGLFWTHSVCTLYHSALHST